jgi:2-polyprenyl-3-methyl-5-hydroxy-6-metoxy-1,4-benzoquinol methylase
MEHLPQQDVYGDNERAEVAPFVPANVRSVLEVGCGQGGFGRTLRRILADDVRLVAVEAVASQAAIARAGGAFDEVVDGYFPEVLAGSHDRFDAVCFLDVLEHIFDPWQVLEDTHAHLNPGGSVIAAIPSIQYAPVLRSLLRGRWDYTDSGTLDRTHVRFFTRDTMVEMFDQAGYRVERCEGVNSVWGSDWEPTLRRRLMVRFVPQSEWLQYVVVATSTRATGTKPVRPDSRS